MPKLDKNTPQGKGIRTGYQAVLGALVGLFTTVWAVPGVPEAVQEYVTSNLLVLALTIGLPAGLFSFLQNRREE